MKKITVWMLALMLVPGVVMLAGCKKAEDETDTTATDAMADVTPTPMAAEPMVDVTPVADVTPSVDVTPSPAAQ